MSECSVERLPEARVSRHMPSLVGLLFRLLVIEAEVYALLWLWFAIKELWT